MFPKISRLLFASMLLSMAPAFAWTRTDPVAAHMGRVLALGFKDARKDLDSNPDQPCGAVEHFRTVFGPLIIEYSTRSGDLRYKKRLKAWYLRYCGHAMGSPAAGDGD